MLEYLSIFIIEITFLHMDIQNVTMQQRSIHCIIMVCMWAFFIGVLLFFQGDIITFIDCHTLKPVVETQGKTVSQFCVQYSYYIFEVMLVILIIIYRQKASGMSFAATSAAKLRHLTPC